MDIKPVNVAAGLVLTFGVGSAIAGGVSASENTGPLRDVDIAVVTVLSAMLVAFSAGLLGVVDGTGIISPQSKADVMKAMPAMIIIVSIVGAVLSLIKVSNVVNTSSSSSTGTQFNRNPLGQTQNTNQNNGSNSSQSFMGGSALATALFYVFVVPCGIWLMVAMA
jgi:hypothetical protein